MPNESLESIKLCIATLDLLVCDNQWIGHTSWIGLYKTEEFRAHISSSSKNKEKWFKRV